jgi:hypothetical protein
MGFVRKEWASVALLQVVRADWAPVAFLQVVTSRADRQPVGLLQEVRTDWPPLCSSPDLQYSRSSPVSWNRLGFGWSSPGS